MPTLDSSQDYLANLGTAELDRILVYRSSIRFVLHSTPVCQRRQGRRRPSVTMSQWRAGSCPVIRAPRSADHHAPEPNSSIHDHTRRVNRCSWYSRVVPMAPCTWCARRAAVPAERLAMILAMAIVSAVPVLPAAYISAATPV